MSDYISPIHRANYAGPEGNGPVYVIDDDNYLTHQKKIDDDGVSESGYKARDESLQPFCSLEGLNAVPPEMIGSREDIAEEIERQERTESSLWHVAKSAPALWLNQSPTNYCWIYAPTQCCMLIRWYNNLPFLRLSPFSAGCLIKNYRNEGGWGTQAVEGFRRYGIATGAEWPMEEPGDSSSVRQQKNMNAIRNGRQYYEGSRASAAIHNVSEWWECRPRNLLEMMSLVVLHGIPVAVGRNWQGHEQSVIRVSIRSRNPLTFTIGNMDNYAVNGRFNEQEMSESRGLADDAIAPRTVTATTT